MIPYRQLSRLTTDLHASAILMMYELTKLSHEETLTLLVLARLSCDDWCSTGTFEIPAKAAEGMTISGLAASLYRSRATTKRHIDKLVELGWLVRDGTQYHLSSSPSGAWLTANILSRSHDLFIRFVEDMHATCDMSFVAPRRTNVTLQQITAAALDIILLPMDRMRFMASRKNEGVIWTLIGALNIRNVTYDGKLARRYCVDQTPDCLRSPVALAPVARLIDMPYATAWRHCRSLEDAGLIEYCPGKGWIVTQKVLGQNSIDEIVLAIEEYVVRRLRILASFGFDMSNAASRYCSGRPPLVAL